MRAPSPEPLPALPGPEGSTHSPAEPLGRGCPKAGPGIAAGGALEHKNLPEDGDGLGGLGGLARSSRTRWDPPRQGRGGVGTPGITSHPSESVVGLEETLQTTSFSPCHGQGHQGHLTGVGCAPQTAQGCSHPQ